MPAELTTLIWELIALALKLSADIEQRESQDVRQFHGVDLCTPALPSLLRQLDTEADTKSDFPTATNVPGNDLLNENNIGLQMFNKINGNKNSNSNRRSVDTTNDHLRKEWARIETMAQKPAGGRRQK